MKYARLVILGEDGENPPADMDPYFMLVKERTTIGRSRSADVTMDSEVSKLQSTMKPSTFQSTDQIFLKFTNSFVLSGLPLYFIPYACCHLARGSVSVFYALPGPFPVRRCCVSMIFFKFYF